MTSLTLGGYCVNKRREFKMSLSTGTLYYSPVVRLSIHLSGKCLRDISSYSYLKGGCYISLPSNLIKNSLPLTYAQLLNYFYFFLIKLHNILCYMSVQKALTDTCTCRGSSYLFLKMKQVTEKLIIQQVLLF